MFLGLCESYHPGVKACGLPHGEPRTHSTVRHSQLEDLEQGLNRVTELCQ